jgi:hypothetical protein
MEKLCLTLLLPGRLVEGYADLYGDMVEHVLWLPDEKDLEALVRENEFQVALEWQRTPYDYTILNLVKKYNKQARVILFLNWKRQVPFDFDKTDYFAHMNVYTPIAQQLEIIKRAKKSLEN